MHLPRSVSLALLFAAAPAAAQQSLAGCYDLTLGPWSATSRPVGGDSIIVAPPPRIQLDTVPADGGSAGALAIRPAPGSAPSVHPFAEWKMAGDRSLHLDWSTGFSGLEMRLEAVEGGLRGTARTHWDFPREPHTATVVARRVSCDAPVSPAQASYRRYPREVRLQDGRTIALGRTLGDGGLALEPTASEVRGDPTGVFAGATRIRVDRSSGDLRHAGRIRRIELLFPQDQDFEVLVGRIARSYGPPTWRTERDGSSSASWSGRDASLSLHGSRLIAGGYEVRIILGDPRT